MARQLDITADTALNADFAPCPHSRRRPPDAAHQAPMPAALRRSMPADAGSHSDGQSGRGGILTLIVHRRAGRFAAEPVALVPSAVAALCHGYLLAICQAQGLDVAEVRRQLARETRPVKDRAWRRAVYARQLAMYCVNTLHNAPQSMIADAMGLSRPAVTLALRQIEDLRDHDDYDRAIELVAASMGVSL